MLVPYLFNWQIPEAQVFVFALGVDAVTVVELGAAQQVDGQAAAGQARGIDGEMPVPRPDADGYVLQEIHGHDVEAVGVERAIPRQHDPDIVTCGVQVRGQGGDHVAEPTGLRQRCKLGCGNTDFKGSAG